MTLVATHSTTAAKAPTLRSWTPPLAWGAGLVLAGMGASAIVADASTPLARGIGVLFVTVGLGALVWGGVSLARGRVVAPRAALAVSLGVVVGLAVLFAATDGRASLLGGAAALALLLATSALVTLERRHPAPPTASVRIVPMLIAATLVAVVATPALGAVQDAALLRDDGTVIVVDPHQGH